MDQLLDILKLIGSLGIMGVLIKFFIDRLWSTQIEFSIETNYNRAFREFFNLCITIIYISIIIFLIYSSYELNKSVQYDVLTSGHYSFGEKEYKEYLTNENRNTKIQSIILVFSFVLIIGVCHGYIRSFWYGNYRRRVYLKFNNRKFYVLKRITKDRVLFTDEIKTFKIIEFSKLNNKNFKLETIEERKKARYKYYYKTLKRLINLKKYTTSEKVITIILFMLLSIVLVLGWWAQEKKGFYTIVMLSIFISIYLFVLRQYLKGKKLGKNDLSSK
ncbi:hypothetical protein [Enterococcus ureasiticus]|uniref:Uncharacterized protein n=1 Tax=Enterococcus ureasiticus TaxID=903984 RepID=A0A1E5GDI6_9ENTE|nr:hypothetical protein [Enterococcus ureasiticus]OEG10749.1 hypothetical protein BCR21_10635 [Enterococcus ureasiticus]